MNMELRLVGSWQLLITTLKSDKKVARTIDLNQIFEFPKFSKWNNIKVDIVNREIRTVRFLKVNGEFMEIVLDDLTWQGLIPVLDANHFKHKYGEDYDFFITGTSYQQLYDIPDNCKVHIKVTIPEERQISLKKMNMYQKVEIECSLDVFHLVNAFALKNTAHNVNR